MSYELWVTSYGAGFVSYKLHVMSYEVGGIGFIYPDYELSTMNY